VRRKPAPVVDEAQIIREEDEADRARRCVRLGTLATAWYRRGADLERHRFLRQISAECDRWVDAFVRQEAIALSLHAPPGSGKSETVGRTMPARAMALAPGRSIVYVTSSGDRAKEVSLSVRSTCERLSKAFPHLAPHPAGPWEGVLWRTAGGGWWTAISPGASTGGVDAHGIIFDDVTGSEARQRSKAEREAIQRFLEGDALTRFRGVGPLMNMETRRGFGDATDFLRAKLGDIFEVKSWPWIATPSCAANPWDGRQEGEYLWPGDRGEVFHQTLGRYLVPGHPVFQAQYQQQPIKEGGAIILEEWMRHRYPGSGLGMAKACHTIIVAVDPAAKKGERNDPTGIVIMGRRRAGDDGSKTMILHAEAERRTSPDSQRRIRALLTEWSAVSGRKVIAVVEDTSVGQAWIPALKELGCTVIAVQVSGKGDKVVRMEPYLGEWAGGMIELPEDEPWVAGYVSEVTGYMGGDGQADNLWDATSVGLGYFAPMATRIQPARPMRLVGA